MLMQVLSLTPDQINALAESERAAIMQLVSHCYYFYTLVRLMFFSCIEESVYGLAWQHLRPFTSLDRTTSFLSTLFWFFALSLSDTPCIHLYNNTTPPH